MIKNIVIAYLHAHRVRCLIVIVTCIYWSIGAMNGGRFLGVVNNPIIKGINGAIECAVPSGVNISYTASGGKQITVKQELPQVGKQELTNLGLSWLQFAALQAACLSSDQLCEETVGSSVITYGIGMPLATYTCWKLTQAMRYGICKTPKKDYYAPAQLFSHINTQDEVVLKEQEKLVFREALLCNKKFVLDKKNRQLLERINPLFYMSSQHIFWIIKNLKPTITKGRQTIMGQPLPCELQHIIFSYVLGAATQQLPYISKEKRALIKSFNPISKYVVAQVIQNARKLTDGDETFSCQLTRDFGVKNPQFIFKVNGKEIKIVGQLARAVIDCYMTDTFGNQCVELAPNATVEYEDRRFSVG